MNTVNTAKNQKAIRLEGLSYELSGIQSCKNKQIKKDILSLNN